MGGDKPAGDLLGCVIFEREDDPFRARAFLCRGHLNTAHDPVRARCGQNLDRIAL